MTYIYLLSIKELRDDRMRQTALGKIDDARRKKALDYKMPGDVCRSIGAGLLLQYAVLRAAEAPGEDVRKTEAPGADGPEAGVQLAEIPLSVLLACIHEPAALFYRYGKRRKPYLDERYSSLAEPFFFSLSHSGDYVLCAAARQEIGADIQRCKEADIDKISRRFFKGKELAALAAASEAEKSKLFYRIWTRKEAYGKLTGGGLAEALNRDVWEEDRGLKWQEISKPEGYCVAVAEYAEPDMEWI